MTEERFEVELTPVEEHRTWRHRRHAPPPPAATPLDAPESLRPPGDLSDDGGIVVSGPPTGTGPQRGWLRSERARLATTAVVAAFVAVLLGWMLGRASRGDPTADEATTSDPIADELTRTTPASTVLAGEPIPPVRTTRPRRTTTVPEIEIGSIGIDERIAGVPIELVTWTSRRILEVDLTTGMTRAVPIAGVSSIEPQFTQVGADWVLLASGVSETTWIVRSDGSAEIADLGEPWSTKWIPGTDRFWRVHDDSWPVSMRLTEIALDGSPTGVELELSTASSGWTDGWIVDPLGGVLTVVAGGVYAVDADGAVLVGRGDLVAAGATAALLRTCDEELACGYVVVDRTTGEPQALVPVDDQGEHVELASAMYFWAPFSARQMSPDGRWASVVTLTPENSVIGVLDLESGRVTALAEETWFSQVHFSSDSRYVFHQRAGQPWVLDLESGDQFPVFTEPAHWEAFGVRDSRAASATGPTPTSSPPSARGEAGVSG